MVVRFCVCLLQKGLKHLTSKPGIVGLVAWHMQEENSIDNRINSLKLVQSLLYDQALDTNTLPNVNVYMYRI